MSTPSKAKTNESQADSIQPRIGFNHRITATRMDIRQPVSELCENFLRFQSDT